jgi:hypothetical protein
MATKKTKKTEAAPVAETKPATKKRTSAHRSPATAKRATKKTPKAEPVAVTAVQETATPAAPAKIPSADQLREQIATLAYHLWIESGYQHGRDQEHWQRAEQLVLSRYSAG